MKKIKIILAGGSGSRLWPISNPEKPKIFHNFEDDTLINKAYNRGKDLFDAQFIITNIHHVGLVKECLPEIKDDFIISEPCIRNTGPALIAAILYIKKHFSSVEIFVSIPADHIIDQEYNWINSISKGLKVSVSKNSNVYFGQKPKKISTQYGFIIKNENDEIESFIEKPDLDLTYKLIKKNVYYNCGIFISSIKLFLNEIKNIAPEIYEEINNNGLQNYCDLQNISIDHLYHQKSQKRIMLEAEFNRMDIGNWLGFKNLLPQDNKSNYFNKQYKAIDSSNNIVFSDKKLNLIGVDDLVIVEGEKDILISKQDRVLEIKSFIDNSNTNKIKAMICDWDGTLVNSMPNKYRNAASIFNRHFKVDKNDVILLYKKYSGIPRKQLFNKIASNLIGRELENEEFFIYSKEFTALNTNNPPMYFDNVLETLNEIKIQGIKIVISSSATQSELESIINKSKIFNFDLVIGSRPGFNKGPDHVNYICNTYDIHKNNLFFIGDERSDIKLAKKASIKSVGILNTISKAEMLEENPDFIVNSFNQLIQIIKLY